MDTEKSFTTRLLLIGGGHSHLEVIKQLALRPMPGVKLTVISRDILTPYSGMLPGLLAGHYQHSDAHIDLEKLCQAAGARLIHSSVSSIDLGRQLAYCDQQPPVRFDWVSINTGSQPDLSSISGANNIGIAVKPIEPFLQHWQLLVDRLKQKPQPMDIAIVGGGAASVEVALAIQYRLQQTLGSRAEQLTLTLVCGSDELLANHNKKVRRIFKQLLAERKITVVTGNKVTAVSDGGKLKLLNLANGRQLPANEIIWAIHAGSPSWPRQSGLDCDANGFIKINHHLQSCSHNHVFAAGDIAHFEPQPLAKSGVYAVRAGKILSDNIRRAISGKALASYHPQRQFLSLLITGDKAAVASRGAFSCYGRWVWHWKDSIDRKFMAAYRDLS